MADTTQQLDPVMLAILALDAYNRGVNPALSIDFKALPEQIGSGITVTVH